MKRAKSKSQRTKSSEENIGLLLTVDEIRKYESENNILSNLTDDEVSVVGQRIFELSNLLYALEQNNQNRIQNE